MTNFLTNILGAITGANPAKKEPKTETTKTETEEAKRLTEAYQGAATYIVDEFGTGSKLNRKALQESSLLTGVNKTNKAKVAEFLGTLSMTEVAKLLRSADNNRDGKVTPQERARFMNGLVAQIENGASPERIQAGINAKFLKNGGEVPDAKRKEWIAEFKEFDIPESAYTPKKATKETDPANDPPNFDFESLAGLITPLINKKYETSSTEKNVNQASINTQKLKDLQAQQQILLSQASTLTPSLGMPNTLGTIPTLPTPTLADFLQPPLLAGGNSFPTAMPAQTTFAQPLAQQQPFTFAPAPVAPVQPFAYTPPAQMAPVQLSTAWMPQATVAQAQVPVAPNLVAQAQSNGGW